MNQYIFFYLGLEPGMKPLDLRANPSTRLLFLKTQSADDVYSTEPSKAQDRSRFVALIYNRLDD